MSTQAINAGSTKLLEAIDRLLVQMSKSSSDSEEYAKLVNQLVKLYHMKEIEYNFHLKELEIDKAHKELDSKMKFSEIELHNKRTEIKNTAKFRQNEIALKGRELDLKTRETDVKCELNDVEIGLKRKQIDLLDRVSLDTWVIVGANLLGILVIIGYERTNVLTSKALSFLSKLR